MPPNLKELALLKALAAAKLIQNEYNRAQVLSALADKLPSELLSDALAAAKLIQNEYYRAQVLSALADKLPSKLLPDALAAAKLIQNEYYRAQVLSALADKLAQMPKSQLFPLWRDSLHTLSLRTRKDLLQDIRALVPTIFALGGQKAIAEISYAISNVSQWWH